MTSQEIFFQKNSSTLRKTLSSHALNGWEEPNLVCRIYKYMHIILWEATSNFTFFAKLLSFHIKVVNVAITCLRMQFSRWPPIVFFFFFARVSVCIPMNQPAFESLVTLQTR